MSELLPRGDGPHAPDAARHPMQVRFTVQQVVAGETVERPARGEKLRQAIKDATVDPHDNPAAALVAAFLLSRSGSPHTRDAYAGDLEQFCSWLYDERIPLLAASRFHIESWLDDLREDHGYKATTRARKLSAVRAFYDYLLDEEIVARNPCHRVKLDNTAGSAEHTLPLSTEQAARLFETAWDADPLDTACVGLMLLGGLRVHEVCDAERKHVHDIGDVRVLHVQGKGDKVRTIPLSHPLAPAIDRHLLGRGFESRWLVAAEPGEQLRRHQVTYRLSVLARQAGLGTERLTPHRLRATFITEALDAGVPLRDVQLASGHASPDTTIGYHHRVDAWRSHPLATVAARLGVTDG